MRLAREYRDPQDRRPGWEFVDLHPEFDVPVDRLATWLARADDEDDLP